MRNEEGLILQNSAVDGGEFFVEIHGEVVKVKLVLILIFGFA